MEETINPFFGLLLPVSTVFLILFSDDLRFCIPGNDSLFDEAKIILYVSYLMFRSGDFFMIPCCTIKGSLRRIFLSASIASSKL